MYINDLPDSLGKSEADIAPRMLKLFADDTKLLAKINSESDFKLTQLDIDKLVNWAKDWRMRFNEDKCKALRICKLSSPTDLYLPFTMTDSFDTIRYIDNTSSERDLGVQVKHNLKWDEQVTLAISRANQALGTLTRTFRCWNPFMVKQLFEIYVRPHLEYSVTTWCPYNQVDVARLERVQERATRLVASLKNLDYADRLRELRMTSLAHRRARGDLIQMHKCQTGKNDISWTREWPRLHSSTATGPCGNTRHAQFPIKETPSLAQRDHFFKNRVIDDWFLLPAYIREASTTNMFKNRLDAHLLGTQRLTTSTAARKLLELRH